MISYLIDVFLCSMVVVAELVGTIILAIAIEVIVYKIFKINLCQKIWKGLSGLDRKLNKILGQKGGKKVEEIQKNSGNVKVYINHKYCLITSKSMIIKSQTDKNRQAFVLISCQNE